MNIIRNDKLIARNARIAQYTVIGGLVVLVGGMLITFFYPQQFALSLSALMLGFILTQIGIPYSNRWGRSPRPDQLLDQAMKGMDKKNTLYHYTTPVNHLLVGPSGLWVLLTYYQRGAISFDKGRWKQRGVNPYLKIFAQESLGRPDLELVGELDALKKFFKERLPEDSLPPIQAALVFTNPRAVIDIPQEAELPAVTVNVKDLKDAIRKGGKNKSLSMEKVKMIEDAIGLTPGEKA